MRIRDLFTVPEGQKVTEKHLRRVLVSSVCSILLCMSCLVGTTWAWFTVSIENKDNVIWIGTPEVKLTVDGSEYPSETTYLATEHIVRIEHTNDGDAFQKKADLYVTLIIQSENGTDTVYTVLDSGNQYSVEVQIHAEMQFTLNWEVSWFAPANATELIDTTIPLVIEKPEETTEPTTETTIPATDPTESVSEPSSEPTGGADTEPTENTTATTEATDPTDVSEETVQPTEENTPPEETEEQEQTQE